jgi:cytoskeletal protein CcmA (bactofilin family)
VSIEINPGEDSPYITGPFVLPKDSTFERDITLKGDATIDGYLKGEVALRDGMLTVNGAVSRDAVVIRGSFLVSGEVEGSLVALGSDGVIKGHIKEDVVVLGGMIQLDSTSVVDGDLVVILGSVLLDSSAVVKGDIEKIEAGPFTRWLRGLLNRLIGSEGVRLQLRKDRHYRHLISGVWRLISIALLYLAGLLALVIFKRWQRRSTLLVERNPWKMLLTGIIMKLAVAAAFVVLVITLVGIALVPFAILFLFFIWILAVPQASLWAGRLIKKLFRMKTTSNVGLYSIGFIGIYFFFILSALLLFLGRWAGIPSRIFYVLGVLAIFVAMAMGRGSIIYAMLFSKEARTLEANAKESVEKPKG